MFWWAGCWKIGGKKTEKIYVLFFLNLYFLEGWSRENQRQKKTEKNISFMFLKLIFLGGLVAGKSAAKKPKYIYIIHIYIL